MSNRIVVVGASGHAKVVVDIVEQCGLYQIVGLIDSFKESGAKLMGYSVLGSEEKIPAILADHDVLGGIIAIGDNWTRHIVAQRIASIAPQFIYVNAIHPSAHVGRDVRIGEGVAIMAGVSINSGTQIGDFCFVNTNASVDHDNVLEEFSCVQPNAATGGNVRVGAFSAVSLGANVIQGISIGRHSIIGAGSTVLADVPESVVAFGTPCRVVRRRKPGKDHH
jgi:sugar O-acyltransferase (sialic acid O-acetyltransferase NeuD family)